MRIGVCTLLFGPEDYVNVLKPHTEKNHESYCNKNGYDYMCFTEPLTDCGLPQWNKCKQSAFVVGCANKAPAILKMFEEGYDYVMFTDADMLFIDPDQKIESLIDGHSDIYVTGDVHDVATACTLIVKNTDFGKKFLAMWHEYDKQISAEVYNQFLSVTTHLFRNSIGQRRLIDQPCLNILLASGKVIPEEEWFNTFNSINLFEGNKFRQHNSSTHSPHHKENVERAHSLIHPELQDHVNVLEQERLWVHANVIREQGSKYLNGMRPILVHFNSPEDKKSMGQFIGEFL
tara:strand:- start:66 stop:932 length:867 start_codon:yes stop_codon:yes gene_type:complete